MKNISSIFALTTAGFITTQTAHADLFLHADFNIAPGFYDYSAPISDLTGRNSGTTTGFFEEGSLFHPSSLGSSGNKMTAYSFARYSSIASEFNQSWYCSYIFKLSPLSLGGIVCTLSPANSSNNNDTVFFDMLSMGARVIYNDNRSYTLQSFTSASENLALWQHTVGVDGSSTLNLWVNPDYSNLASPTLSATFNQNQQFYSFGVTNTGLQGFDYLDEIRFGTELSDVVTIPTPITTATFAIAGIFAAKLRRR